MSRLNPKLTKRALASSFQESDNNQSNAVISRNSGIAARRDSSSTTSTTSASQHSDSTFSSMNSGPELSIPFENPNIHLLHNGSWIPKVFEVGRHVPFTGIWSCCGNTEHFSLYCESLVQRESFQKTYHDELERRTNERLFRETRKVQLQSFMNQVEQENATADDQKEAQRKAELEDKKRRGVFDADEEAEKEQQRLKQLTKEEYLNMTDKERDLNNDARLYQLASDDERAFHAPVLVSWLMKSFHEESTSLIGLNHVLRHCQVGEGCVLLVKHGVVDALKRIHYQFLSHADLQLLIIRILRQLLDCNFTRDVVLAGKLEQEAIGENDLASTASQDSPQPSTSSSRYSHPSQELVQIIMTIAHRNMRSSLHVEHAAQCALQCSRSPHARQCLISLQAVSYFQLFSRKFMDNPRIMRSLLRLMLWLTASPKDIEEALRRKALHFTKEIMRRHLTDSSVCGPAVVYLRHAVSLSPAALKIALTLDLPPLVIKALRVLANELDVQLEALRFLKILSLTSEGWEQIDKVRGGWQAITSGGGAVADSLIHELPGEFQNKGWTIGETKYMPAMDRMKLDAQEEAKNSLQGAPIAAWTTQSLRQYMGLSMNGQVLSINTEYHELFFELLQTLDLLPFPGEEKEDWFVRTRGFEKENGVSIDDMVATVQEMRQRENVQRKLEQQRLVSTDDADGIYGSIKEIYVKGKVVTTESLQKNDADIAETLDYDSNK